MLQGWCLNSRYTRDMKNNMEAHTYAHTHIVLAKVQYEENRPAHLVLHTRQAAQKCAACRASVHVLPHMLRQYCEQGPRG